MRKLIFLVPFFNIIPSHVFAVDDFESCKKQANDKGLLTEYHAKLFCGGKPTEKERVKLFACSSRVLKEQLSIRYTYGELTRLVREFKTANPYKWARFEQELILFTAYSEAAFNVCKNIQSPAENKRREKQYKSCLKIVDSTTIRGISNDYATGGIKITKIPIAVNFADRAEICNGEDRDGDFVAKYTRCLNEELDHRFEKIKEDIIVNNERLAEARFAIAQADQANYCKWSLD